MNMTIFLTGAIVTALTDMVISPTSIARAPTMLPLTKANLAVAGVVSILGGAAAIIAYNVVRKI